MLYPLCCSGIIGLFGKMIPCCSGFDKLLYNKFFEHRATETQSNIVLCVSVALCSKYKLIVWANLSHKSGSSSVFRNIIFVLVRQPDFSRDFMRATLLSE